MSPLDGLLPASFRGVPFNVASDKDTQGREGDIKTFPRRDGARVDDHGLGKREITVEAHVSAFTTSALAAEAFRAAMLAPGLGPLMLPTAFVPRALCTQCERSFSRDKVGILAFSLKFVAHDEGLSAPGLSALASAVSVAAAAVAARLPGMISPPGASQAFLSGTAAGLGIAAAAVRAALPAVTVVSTLPSMAALAAALPATASAAEVRAAEFVATKA